VQDVVINQKFRLDFEHRTQYTILVSAALLLAFASWPVQNRPESALSFWITDLPFAERENILLSHDPDWPVIGDADATH
jgi:hypothetical protein